MHWQLWTGTGSAFPPRPFGRLELQQMWLSFFFFGWAAALDSILACDNLMRVGLGLVAGAGCDVEVTVDQLLIQFEIVWELWCLLLVNLL